jgi:hypothetical protein
MLTGRPPTTPSNMPIITAFTITGGSGARYRFFVKDVRYAAISVAKLPNITS